ncbi:MAG: hypothetical protein HC772_14235 [Leptolyngbyaceae cyanobacterium CRU_2_3]|nr:hypothetical protein [Leptolyngbyaceae cyanobacterium CRU_2_3]
MLTTKHLINLCVLLFLVLSVGCTQLRFPGQLSDVLLNVHVTASEVSGTYTIAGETNLPQNTPLTVAAVRYLSVDNSTAAQFNPVPTYSILAYQTVKVVDGKWQTQLNLWQVAPNGKYQETWQLEQARLGIISFKPSKDVIFLATLTPVEKLSRLEQKLARQGMRLASGTVRSTPEGQRYAQANQTLAIALPRGETTPPQPQLDQVNYGWGYRYLIPKEPQNPYNLEFPGDRQTTAPPRPEEFLQ